MLDDRGRVHHGAYVNIFVFFWEINGIALVSLQCDGTPYECFLENETWTAYLSRMARDGEWGDHIVLKYVSMFKVSLFFKTTFFYCCQIIFSYRLVNLLAVLLNFRDIEHWTKIEYVIFFRKYEYTLFYCEIDFRYIQFAHAFCTYIQWTIVWNN